MVEDNGASARIKRLLWKRSACKTVLGATKGNHLSPSNCLWDVKNSCWVLVGEGGTGLSCWNLERFWQHHPRVINQIKILTRKNSAFCVAESWKWGQAVVGDAPGLLQQGKCRTWGVFVSLFFSWYCAGVAELCFFPLKQRWGRPVVELVQRHMPGVGKSCYPQLGNCCTIQNSTANFWFAAALDVEIIKNMFSVPESFSVCTSGARWDSCCCLSVLWPNLFISSSKLLVILRNTLNKLCQLNHSEWGKEKKNKPTTNKAKKKPPHNLIWLLWETIIIVLHLQIFHLC